MPKISQSKINSILKKIAAGDSVADLAAKYDVTATTIHNWKKKYKSKARYNSRSNSHLKTQNRQLKEVIWMLLLKMLPINKATIK
jgi:transposase-like protein